MMLKQISWNPEKNRLLRETRGVSFEDVEAAIELGKVLADEPHPLEDKYPGQRMLIVQIGSYVFNVPYVQDQEGIFLKTIYPSRKSKKLFLNRDQHDPE